MRHRFIFHVALVGILAMALFLAARPLEAAPVRVTSWNLQPDPLLGTNAWSAKFQQALIQEAAGSLKKLNPEVILLQQVAGWETCNQLALALRPEVYQVTICSSFRDPRTKLLGPQVAILSKAKSYLSWSDSWPSSAESPAAPGGFAFAAIRLGDKNVGIFSVQLRDGNSSEIGNDLNAAAQRGREESARQLVKEIASLENWKTNRLEAFVVAGDFNTSRDDSRLAREQTLTRLEQSGFENAFAGLPLGQRVTAPGNARRPDATLDYIFTRDASVAAGPLISQPALSGHSGVTCDLDFAAPKRIPSNPTNQALMPVALAKANRPDGSQVYWWLAAMVVLALALFVLARKIARRSKLQPAQGALAESKPKNLITIAAPQADQIIAAPMAESAPFVHIEMASATQTQSQSWPVRADAGRVATPMPEAVRAGLMANLSHWLKQKFVQRLVSDRAQLLATQQAAALKVLAVDERLTKIERQIQQRNREYEKRIDELQQELLTARAENRELIRAKIALVKAEMEKARLKTGQHAGHHQN